MGVGGPGVRRVTGLQRQIFHLYRRALVVVASKPPETRSSWYQFISHHFRHPSLGGGLRKQDVGAIEYYLRRGEKMLESYSQDGVKGVSVPEGEWWPEGWVVKHAKMRPVGEDTKGKAKEEAAKPKAKV